MKMERKNWENEYPKMPESFHLALLEAVDKCCEMEESEILVENEQAKMEREETAEPSLDLKELLVKRDMSTATKVPRKNWKKIYILGIAATLTLGIAVAGVTGNQLFSIKKQAFDLAEYLGYESREGIEGLFQKDIEVSISEEASLPLFVDEMEDEKEKEQYIYWWESNQKEREDNSPLLEIKEVMYDGFELAVYATATEAGEQYTLGADGLNVNSTRVPNGSEGKFGEENDYVFYVNQSVLEFEPPFEVTLPLSVYKDGDRYENQDYTFIVDTEAEIVELPDKEFEFEDYTVRVTGLRKSLTAIRGTVEIFMTKEQRKTYENSDRVLCGVRCESTDGEAWKWKSATNWEEESAANKSDNALCWDFYQGMPEIGCESVVMYFLAYEKSAVEETFDLYASENVWGEGVEISLSENEG